MFHLGGIYQEPFQLFVFGNHFVNLPFFMAYKINCRRKNRHRYITVNYWIYNRYTAFTGFMWKSFEVLVLLHGTQTLNGHETSHGEWSFTQLCIQCLKCILIFSSTCEFLVCQSFYLQRDSWNYWWDEHYCVTSTRILTASVKTCSI